MLENANLYATPEGVYEIDRELEDVLRGDEKYAVAVFLLLNEEIGFYRNLRDELKDVEKFEKHVFKDGHPDENALKSAATFLKYSLPESWILAKYPEFNFQPLVIAMLVVDENEYFTIDNYMAHRDNAIISGIDMEDIELLERAFGLEDLQHPHPDRKRILNFLVRLIL